MLGGTLCSGRSVVTGAYSSRHQPECGWLAPAKRYGPARPDRVTREYIHGGVYLMPEGVLPIL